jgi:hypothetical protein
LEFRAATVAGIDELTDGADRLLYRRLTRLRGIVKSL